VEYDIRKLKQWAERRQAAPSGQMHIIAELISEAATNFYSDPQEALGLLDVAETFFKVDCPLAERRRTTTIFRETASKLKSRHCI